MCVTSEFERAQETADLISYYCDQVEKHQGYALQWYSLAALAIVLLVVLSFRKA